MNSVSARRFEGKVALVTGGATGIGRAAALGFAREGAAVVVAGRREAELAKVVAEIEALDAKALAVTTDVSDPAQVTRLVGATLDRFGRLDAAFNNAGIEGTFAPITELTPENFDETIGINLKGVFLTVKAEITAMLAAGTGGAIVNTSSWLAHGSLAGGSIYSASKAALDGMIRAVALEVADRGIRINNVNPGIIDTPMFRRFVTDAAGERPFIGNTPAGRLGTSEEVADAVLFLASDQARFITGQNLLVDGGYTIPGHR